MSSSIAHYLDQAVAACPACDGAERCLPSLTKSITLYFADQPATYEAICQVFGPPEQAVADCLAEPDATVLLLDARPRRRRLSLALVLTGAVLLTTGILGAHLLLWSDARAVTEDYTHPVYAAGPVSSDVSDSVAPFQWQSAAPQSS